MGLLRIAVRVAARRYSGQVYDLGPGNLEMEAIGLAAEIGADDVKGAIVTSFDKAFGTNYSEGKVPFFDEIKDLGVDDLFHELLHHAISPEKYTDYASSIEGAFHEHVIRGYQSSVGSAESMSTAFEMLGFDGNKYYSNQDPMAPDEAQKFLEAFKADIAKAERPEIKPLLERAAKRIEAIIRRNGPGKDIYKEMDYIVNQAEEMEGEFIPAGTEERVREWYRWLELALRQLRD
jgi:hypothetical protein